MDITADQWCNHDSPAIDADGTCECGARVLAFPTADAMAMFLAEEYGRHLDAIGALTASLADGDSHTTDVSDRPGHHDYRVLARVGGWYLVLPYRTDEAIRR